MKKSVLGLCLIVSMPAMALEFNCQSSSKIGVHAYSKRLSEEVTANGIIYNGTVTSMYKATGDVVHKYSLQDSTGSKASLFIDVKTFERPGSCRARVCPSHTSSFITGKFVSKGLNLDLTCFQPIFNL